MIEEKNGHGTIPLLDKSYNYDSQKCCILQNYLDMILVMLPLKQTM